MEEQAEHIWNNGHYLTTIEYYGYKVNLYSVGREFYEVFYNSALNDIDKISQATEEDLKKYLNRIVLQL